MRIYLQPPQPSRGLQRIADALVRYKPEWVEVVSDEAQADLVVLYAIGRRDAILAKATEILRRQQEYVVIQVCLRSTQKPNTKDWRGLWRWATMVWSYYDLDRASADDGVYAKLPNFYHAPLGADAEVFYPRWQNPMVPTQFVIATSGLSRLSESVRECALAAAEVGKHVFHLGPQLQLGGHAVCRTNISDNALANVYSACEFVSALRRKEGFELPGIEGLLCGARPICFNTPDYRWAYGNHAIYIEETDRQGVIDQLVQLFRHGAPPVTAEEREAAVKRYNWETIVGGFYERLA